MSNCVCCKKCCPKKLEDCCPCKRENPVRKPFPSPTRVPNSEIKKVLSNPQLCTECCCIIKKTEPTCYCKHSKSPERSMNIRNPRILTVDLPLFDERSHLLGYIKQGSIIEEPSCSVSQDLVLEKRSYPKYSETTRPLYSSCCEGCCLSSCKYANSLKSSKPSTSPSPRWTTKSGFQQSIKPKKTTKKCNC